MDLSKLNNLIKTVQLEDVTEESGSGFKDLPDGFYISEVKKIDLKETKTNQDPMISIQFEVVDDGLTLNEEGTELVTISKTKGRFIFVNYVLKDEASFKRFVSDMLKFEDKTGVPLLEKPCFSGNTELMLQSLELLIGFRIYIQLSTSDYKDGKNQWKNLISWNRATNLGLPY